VAGGSGPETMRLRRGEAAEVIIQAFASGVFGMFREGRDSSKETMKGMVVEGRRTERAPGVKVVLDRVLKAFEE